MIKSLIDKFQELLNKERVVVFLVDALGYDLFEKYLKEEFENMTK